MKQRKRRLIAWLAALGAVLPVVQAQPAVAAPAAIITASSTGEAPKREDPIVSPGAESAHLHSFYGAVGVTRDTLTADQFRALPETWAIAGNHTGVWIPTVFEDGRELPPLSTRHILLYYKGTSCTEQVPPDDAAVGVTREFGYRNTTGGGSFSQSVPASTQGPLVVTLIWRASRDFPAAGCFPTIQAYVRLNAGAGPIGQITLGGPSLSSPGATDASGMHGDYRWAWDRTQFERFLSQCVRPGAACGTDPAFLR